MANKLDKKIIIDQDLDIQPESLLIEDQKADLADPQIMIRSDQNLNRKNSINLTENDPILDSHEIVIEGAANKHKTQKEKKENNDVKLSFDNSLRYIKLNKFNIWKIFFCE